MTSGDELIPRLRELYQLMDQAYAALAAETGFSCRGCDGVACCTVDVTLYTFAEMLYLRRGLRTLDEDRRDAVLQKSRAMVAARKLEPLGDAYRQSVCALNFQGLCSLYHYRPMICRLAGIPHFFVRPNGDQRESAGCARFQREKSPTYPDVRLDRTRFYRTMAEIEIDAVRACGQRTIPLTIAQTLESGIIL